MKRELKTHEPANVSLETTATARWLALTAALLGWMFDGLEMGLFPLVARPALLELMGPSASERIGTWISIVIAVFLVGAAAGGIIFGWLGDRIGRVRAMVWSVLTYAIFSGLCGFAAEPWQLAGLRFLAALGMGGEWSLGVALVMEIWPSSSRPMLAGLIGAAANVGFLLIALVGLGLSQIVHGVQDMLHGVGLSDDRVAWLLGHDQAGWRILMMLGAAPAVLTFFIRLFVPESKRWKQAAQNAPKARVADIFQPGLARHTILGTCLGALALLGTWGSYQWTPSWADKLSKEQLERLLDSRRNSEHRGPPRMGMPPEAADWLEEQDAQWNRRLEQQIELQRRVVATAKSWTQISASIGAIIATILAALVADWFSRRPAYFALCLLSLVSCAYLFRVPIEFGNYFLLMIGLVGGLTAGFYGWLPLYLPELFPTRVRATGQGFAFNFGRVLAAAGTLVSGQLLNYFKEDYARMCSVISLIYVVGLVLIWFCPETKGKPLPE